MGEFLRFRRARLTPEAVGVEAGGRARRVPGLRREEVARLAGVSTDYYTRLEQGRHPNVSESVLAGVARALRLGPVERDHLFHLARPRGAQSSRDRARVERVRPEALPNRERNFARFVLLSPDARKLYDDWEAMARTIVANLRMSSGRHPDDIRLNDLIGEIGAKVPESNAWWASHQLDDCGHGTQLFHHAVVGELTLHHEALSFSNDPDQTMCLYTAEPGSSSAQTLALLASWSAPGTSVGARSSAV